MRNAAPPSAADIDKIARNLLREAKALGVFPTPVANISQTAELLVQRGVNIATIKPGYFTVGKEVLQGALRKLLGAVDLRAKVIYLDDELHSSRKKFVELHETGHGVIPWQRDMCAGYGDDDQSLDPDIQELFEREASYFASSALFQLDRFDDEAERLPLEFGSIQFLAKKFGASIQATARRFVTHTKARCALLVLKNPPPNGSGLSVEIRNCFESPEVLREFGQLSITSPCGEEFPFVQDIKLRRKMKSDGKIVIPTEKTLAVTARYQFFHNSYNYFVLIFPPEEHLPSRVRFVRGVRPTSPVG